MSPNTGNALLTVDMPRHQKNIFPTEYLSRVTDLERVNRGQVKLHQYGKRDHIK